MSRALRGTGEVVSEHPGAHHFAFSLSGSIWEYLEGLVWLFRVAEMFSYNLQTILQFADVCVALMIILPDVSAIPAVA